MPFDLFIAYFVEYFDMSVLVVSVTQGAGQHS